MIIATDLRGYQMAIPFRFEGREYPSGSWILVWGHGVRMAYAQTEIEDLFPGLTDAR